MSGQLSKTRLHRLPLTPKRSAQLPLPSSLPTLVLAAPDNPCAAKKHSACTLKVMPIMDMVISGCGSSPDSITMICEGGHMRSVSKAHCMSEGAFCGDRPAKGLAAGALTAPYLVERPHCISLQARRGPAYMHLAHEARACRPSELMTVHPLTHTSTPVCASHLKVPYPTARILTAKSYARHPETCSVPAVKLAHGLRTNPNPPQQPRPGHAGRIGPAPRAPWHSHILGLGQFKPPDKPRSSGPVPTSKVHQSRQIMTADGMATRMYRGHSVRHSLLHPTHVRLAGSCT